MNASYRRPSSLAQIILSFCQYWHVGETDGRIEPSSISGLSRRDALILAATGTGVFMLGDLVGAKPAAAAILWRYPLAALTNVTAYFNEHDPNYWESTNHFHRGVDFGASANTPILAMAEGTVTSGFEGYPGWGNWVRINHGSGGDGHIYYSLYAHMDTPTIATGSVNAGDTVGYVGKSGTDAYHLHIEITQDGIYDANRRNPFDYIPSSPGGNPPIPTSPIDPGDDMSILYIAATASSDGKIPVNWGFLDPGNGPLRPLSTYQKHNLLWFAELDDSGNTASHTVPGGPFRIRLVKPSGDSIMGIIRTVGCMDWTVGTDFEPRLNGKVFQATSTGAYPIVTVAP